MADPRCDLCQASLWDFTNHVCDPEGIRKHFTRLEEDRRKAKLYVDRVKNAVSMMLSLLPSLEGEKIEVSGDWLRKLWDMTDCEFQDGESKTADNFLSHWLVSHRILCEAFDLFRSTKHGNPVTVLYNLRELRHACDEAKRILCPDGEEFTLTPEDILKG